MSTPSPDDLERRLTELFEQRAATVTQVRQFETGPADDRRSPLGRLPGRNHPRWQKVGVLVAAAAVFLAVVGTVLEIQAHQPKPAPPLGTPTATPTPTRTSCSVDAPAKWQQAIAAGAVRMDRSLNAVVSANGKTGDYLVIQGNDPVDRRSQIYSDLTLALYHGSEGSTIYTPANPKYFLQADPTGAISADWITFAVAYPHGADYRYQVMLYQRGTGALRTLAGGVDQPNPEHKLVRGAPVIAAGKVYWLAAVDNHAETTTLESWDLSRNAAAGPIDVSSVSGPNSFAKGLVGYGSGVAVMYESLLSDSSGITTVLRNGAGTPLTKVQLDAATGGSNFGYDGTGKLSWLRRDGDSIGYSALIVGGTGVSNEPLISPTPGPADSVGISVAVFPFAAAVVKNLNGLVDFRTGTAVALRIDQTIEAVIGDTVVFGTGSHYSGQALGSTGLSLVPLSALPPTRC